MWANPVQFSLERADPVGAAPLCLATSATTTGGAHLLGPEHVDRARGEGEHRGVHAASVGKVAYMESPV